MVEIFYGSNGNTINVTNICFDKLKKHDIITIPNDDNSRNLYFSDVSYGRIKFIYILINSVISKYSSTRLVKINTKENIIKSINMPTILYGVYGNTINVTNICLNQLTNNNIITIPNNDDTRNQYFTDPCYGTQKFVFIHYDDDDDDNDIIYQYNTEYFIKIDMNNSRLSVAKVKTNVWDNNNINNKLNLLYSELKLNNNTNSEETSENKMVIRYLTGKETVLKIGGNLGKNSLLVSYILGGNNSLVTLENDESIVKLLTLDRDLNNLNFHIENSMLSMRTLIQNDCNIIQSKTLDEGYSLVNTINLTDLKKKYNVDFDTLILNCSGLFYYILMDMPEILNNINLIITKNDYEDISCKEYVDKVLKENDFYVDCVEIKENIEEKFKPLQNRFFEVWKKLEYSVVSK